MEATYIDGGRRGGTGVWGDGAFENRLAVGIGFGFGGKTTGCAGYLLAELAEKTGDSEVG